MGSMSRRNALIDPASDSGPLVSGPPAGDLVAATTAAQCLCRDLFLVDLIRREDLSDAAAGLFFGQGVPGMMGRAGSRH